MHIAMVSGTSGVGKTMVAINLAAISKDVQLIDCTVNDGTVALNGCDACIVVTEPTESGVAALERVIGVVADTGVPYGVVINKAGTGDWGLYRMLSEQKIPFLGEIPFDPRIAKVCYCGRALVTELPEYRQYFEDILQGMQFLAMK